MHTSSTYDQANESGVRQANKQSDIMVMNGSKQRQRQRQRQRQSRLRSQLSSARNLLPRSDVESIKSILSFSFTHVQKKAGVLLNG